MRIFLCISLVFIFTVILHAQILMMDYGFENQPTGELTDDYGWLPYRSLPDFIHDVEETGVAYAGEKNAFISIPASATGFQHVSIGQWKALETGVEYRASVKVQWVNYTAGETAIVSFWAYHKNSTNYAGKDVWINSPGWQEISFNFYNIGDAGDEWKIYISFLPHQIPKQMDLRLDNFILTKAGNLMEDFSLENQPLGDIPDDQGWTPYLDSPSFTVITEKGVANSGYQSAKLVITADATQGQKVNLSQLKNLSPGSEYEVYCYINWFNYSAGDTAKVDFFTHQQNLDNYYGGSFDITTSGWHKISYTFTASGNASDWNKIYIGLQAQGKEILLGIDDFTVCKLIHPSFGDGSINLMNDFSFEAQPLGDITTNYGWDFWKNSSSLTGVVEDENPYSGSKHVRLAIPANTSNYESMILGQWKKLDPGAEYLVNCWATWNNYTPGESVILIFWAWHAPSGTWYGADDVHFSTAGWQELSFKHIPIGKSGDNWRIYVSLNGWGNFGDPVEFLIDDFSMFKIGPTSIENNEQEIIPTSIKLSQNFPNPFNPETTIQFALPYRQHAKLVVYGINGREISTVVDQVLSSGNHSVKWHGVDKYGHRVASGLYYYQLQTGDLSITKKLMLVK